MINILTLRGTYQFTKATFARVILDYNTLNSRLRSQALFGWTPSPGTAFYAGYNDDLNYASPHPFTQRDRPRLSAQHADVLYQDVVPDPARLLMTDTRSDALEPYVNTPKALANSSPGLLQPWVHSSDLVNTESVRFAIETPSEFNGLLHDATQG